MPKKKTGQRKKAEKQKERQKQLIRAPKTDIGKAPGNAEMICDQCNKRQKNRAFCYFCQSLQRLPMCAHCGRTKCMQAGGDCLVKHMGTFATGVTLVGAICDFCEAWVCHSRRCLQKHSCPCPLEGAVCAECNRTIPEHGGRMFRCSFCSKWLCEDDQFEHQASCQTLDTDTYKCISCNKMGGWVCLKCKISFCDLHVQSATTKFAKKEKEIDCKKCHQPLKDISNLSVSVRKLDFGRQTYDSTHQGEDDDDGEGQGTATFSFGGRTVTVQRQQYSDDEDDEDQVMHKFGNLSTYDNEGYDYEYDEEEDEDDEDDEEDDEDDEDGDDDEEDEDEANNNQ